MSLPLPDDLLLSCIARVSNSYYPTLSLVSKRFQSLLASPELYKARSLLGHTEICLYVCMKFYSDPNPRWFTLCRKPEKNLTNDTSKKKKKKPSGYVLADVAIPDSPRVYFSGLVAASSSIYNIGGFRRFLSIASPSTVSILDCMSQTLREGPSLPVGTRPILSLNDINSYKPIVAYNSKEGKWDVVEQIGMDYFRHGDSYCEIENVLCCAYQGALRWYDTKDSHWKRLRGVKLPKFSRGAFVRLADCGGKMAVFWDQDLPYSRDFSGSKKAIWCAEIVLERSKRYVIWGKVLWYEQVLRVPACELVKLVKALAVTV